MGGQTAELSRLLIPSSPLPAHAPPAHPRPWAPRLRVWKTTERAQTWERPAASPPRVAGTTLRGSHGSASTFAQLQAGNG